MLLNSGLSRSLDFMGESSCGQLTGILLSNPAGRIGHSLQVRCVPLDFLHGQEHYEELENQAHSFGCEGSGGFSGAFCAGDAGVHGVVSECSGV